MQRGNREKIVHKYLENPSVSARQLAKSLNLSERTVRYVIKSFETRLTIDRAPGSGSWRRHPSKKLHDDLLKSFEENPGMSNRERAKKFRVDEKTIRNFRDKAGLKSYKAIKYPNRTDKQESEVKKRSRLLYDEILTKHHGCLLVDDETYVKLDLKQLPGNKFYLSTIRGAVLPKWKYVCVDKFAKKALIWQGICSCGKRTRTFITSSTMTSDIYIKECLIKRVLPFIRQHHGSVKFWPDLASCHYSKKTLDWYQNNGVDFIPKHMNPPNTPQFRPIEKYWAIVKAKLKKNGGIVQNVGLMRAKWNYFSGKVTKEVVQNLMGSIRRKVRKYIRTNEM